MQSSRWCTAGSMLLSAVTCTQVRLDFLVCSSCWWFCSFGCAHIEGHDQVPFHPKPFYNATVLWLSDRFCDSRCVPPTHGTVLPTNHCHGTAVLPTRFTTTWQLLLQSLPNHLSFQHQTKNCPKLHARSRSVEAARKGTAAVLVPHQDSVLLLLGTARCPFLSLGGLMAFQSSGWALTWNHLCENAVQGMLAVLHWDQCRRVILGQHSYCVLLTQTKWQLT